MQEEITTPTLGPLRAGYAPMFGKEWEDYAPVPYLRGVSHLGQIDRFWECMACGHLVPADEVRDVNRN